MNYRKKTVRDIDVKGKKVLLRCDFNVPQDKKTGAAETDTVAPLLAAQAILTEGLCDTVFLNQVDNAELLGRVMPFLQTAAAGGLFTAAGSLQGDWGKRF